MHFFTKTKNQGDNALTEDDLVRDVCVLRVCAVCVQCVCVLRVYTVCVCTVCVASQGGSCIQATLLP